MPADNLPLLLNVRPRALAVRSNGAHWNHTRRQVDTVVGRAAGARVDTDDPHAVALGVRAGDEFDLFEVGVTHNRRGELDATVLRTVLDARNYDWYQCDLRKLSSSFSLCSTGGTGSASTPRTPTSRARWRRISRACTRHSRSVRGPVVRGTAEGVFGLGLWIFDLGEIKNNRRLRVTAPRPPRQGGASVLSRTDLCEMEDGGWKLEHQPRRRSRYTCPLPSKSRQDTTSKPYSRHRSSSDARCASTSTGTSSFRFVSP